MPSTAQSDVLIPERVEIKIGTETVVMKPLVFSQRTRVMNWLVKSLEKVMTEDSNASEHAESIKSQLKSGDFRSSIEVMKPYLGLFGDDMAEVYGILIGKSTDFVKENLTLSNEIDIWEGFFKLNDIPLLVEKVRGLRNLSMTPKTVQQST